MPTSFPKSCNLKQIEREIDTAGLGWFVFELHEITVSVIQEQ